MKKTLAPVGGSDKATAVGQHSIYVFHGNDEFTMNARVKEMIDRLVSPEEQTLGLEIVNGRVDNSDEVSRCLDRCIGALQTPGFLGSGRVVWLRDPDFLAGGKKGVPSDSQERLAALIRILERGLMPGQKLVVSIQEIDERQAFFKTCKRHGEVMEFSVAEKAREATQQTVEFARGELTAAGIRSVNGAIELLVERIGSDTRQIASEVQKVILFLGKRRDVTPDDVLAIVPVVRETAAWDFADSFGSRNLTATLKVLRQLIFQKESHIGLIVGLERRINDLIVLRTAMEREWASLQGSGSWKTVEWHVSTDVSAVLDVLGKDDPRKLNPYRAGKLMEQAVNFSKSELLKARELTIQAREQMVSSGGASPVVMLELLVVRLLGSVRR